MASVSLLIPVTLFAAFTAWIKNEEHFQLIVNHSRSVF